jgi:hypothetical protein
MGNAMLFSQDLAANRYNRAVAGWEAGEESRRLRYQADLYANQTEASRAQSSWLKKTAGGLGTSLLTAGISGLGAGLSGYLRANIERAEKRTLRQFRYVSVCFFPEAGLDAPSEFQGSAAAETGGNVTALHIM